MIRPLAALLTLCCLATLPACATPGPRTDAAAPPTDAPAWYDAAPAGALIGRAQAGAANAAVAESAAIEDARDRLSILVNEAIADLAAPLRPAVGALDDDAQRRFENARHLAASETLRLAEPVRIETYLEPDGRYRAFAALATDANEPALHLYEELRRIDGLAERLSASDAWRTLAARAAARRAGRASPLPPVGAG